jgi:hypothetical protein
MRAQDLGENPLLMQVTRLPPWRRKLDALHASLLLDSPQQQQQGGSGGSGGDKTLARPSAAHPVHSHTSAAGAGGGARGGGCGGQGADPEAGYGGGLRPGVALQASGPSGYAGGGGGAAGAGGGLQHHHHHQAWGGEAAPGWRGRAARTRGACGRAAARVQRGAARVWTYLWDGDQEAEDGGRGGGPGGGGPGGGGQGMGGELDGPGGRAHASTYETEVLEDSIGKIGALLAVGFGDAGAGVLGGLRRRCFGVCAEDGATCVWEEGGRRRAV